MAVERVPMLHVPLLPPHAEAVGNHTVVAARHMVAAADNLTAAAGLTSN